MLNLKEEFPLSKISLVFGCGATEIKTKGQLWAPLQKSIAKIYI